MNEISLVPEAADSHQGRGEMMGGETAGFCYDIPRLLQIFEGLGENCDFRVAQRAIGIEPFGLFRLAASKAGDGRALRAPSGEWRRRHEHRLDKTEATSVYCEHLPIASDDFVFSAWILISEGFRGRHIATLLAGSASIAMWTAALKSHVEWQRLWVMANLPAAARSICYDIIAEVAVDVFQSSSLYLKHGNRPSGYGFPL